MLGQHPYHVVHQMIISGGIDYFNNNSKIIIKKYLISLKANTPVTFGSSVEIGGQNPSHNNDIIDL